MTTSRKPLPKKRATPRTWRCGLCQARVPSTKKSCPECRTRRGTGRRAMGARCDALWAKIVRTQVICQGGCGYSSMEAAHIVPRRFRSTRWMIDNGRALCRACHAFYTNHEAAWRAFIGGDEYDRLWNLAQVRWDGDYEKVLRTLKEEQGT